MKKIIYFFLVFFCCGGSSTFGQEVPCSSPGAWNCFITTDPAGFDALFQVTYGGSTGLVRQIPYYNDKVLFALPGQANGTPFLFKDLGNVDSGVPTYYHHVFPYYVYQGNEIHSSFNFYPSTANEGINTIEEIAKRIIQPPVNAVPPVTVYTPVTVTTVTVEIPTFINKADIENICNDQPSFIIADYFKNLTNVSFYLDDVSATQVDPGSLSLGQHKITAKKQYHNGLYEEDFYIRILAKPTPTIIADKPLSVCDGEKVTLSTQSPPAGENYTYLWSSGQTSASIEVSVGGTYSVNVSNGECFTVSPSVDITILPKPDATINIVGNTTLCAGEEVTFYAPNSTSYIWKEGNTVVGNNQSFATKLAGLYTCTVTGNNGCTNISQPIAIVVKDNPIPTVSTSGPTTFCEGENVLLTAQSIGVPTAYEWSNGETTKTISVTQTGIYYVNVINQGGCVARSADIQVNVNPSPKPIITSNGLPDICQGETLTLTATGSASYLWSNGATTQSIMVNSTGSYFVKTTNAQGCVRTSDPFAVTVKQKPVAVISTSGSPILCSGNTVTLTSNVGDSYLWSTGQNTQSIIVSQAGSYTVQVTSNGCSTVSNPINVTVNVPTLATITPSAPQTICFGETKTLTASQAVSYLWSNGETSSSIEVSTPGFYSVTTTDVNGCKSTSATVHIQVRPEFLPQISVVGTTTFCEGLSTTLIATTGSSYLWSTGQTTQSIIVTQAGTYNAIVTNASGCSVAANPVVINTLPSPKPFIASLGPTTFCQGDSVTLNISNPQPNTIYTWSNGSVGNNIIVKQSGSYTVYGTYQNGCIKISDPLAITVYNIAKPTVSASGPTTFCDGESITLTINEIGSSYRWSTGQTTKSIIVSGNGSYTGYISNAQGCERESLPVNVLVNPSPIPQVNIAGSTTLCQGESSILNVSNPQANTTYEWSDGQTGTSVSVNTTGIYFVTASYSNGCKKISTSIPITVLASPKPTIFASGATTFCQGESVLLTINESAPNYLWSTGETTKSITVYNSGNFSAKIINANGCERVSDPLVITVKESVKPGITISGSQIICEGDSTQLSISNPQPGAVYTWSTNKVGNSIYVSKNGNYYVSAAYLNSCNKLSDIIPITVNAIPKPTITVQGGLDICHGDSVVLKINETGASYRWSNGATTKSIIVKESETFTGFIKNAQGCERETDPISINVRANPKPIITASGLTTFCQGDSVLLSIPNVIGSQYVWSNGISGTNKITVKASGNYFVSVTNANNCLNVSQTVPVNVYPIPKPTINVQGGLDICHGDSVVLTIKETGASYRWSNGATTKSIIVKESETFTGFIMNVQGCERETDPISINVRANPKPVITASGLTTFCQGDSVLLSIPNVIGSQYAWSNGISGTNKITVKASGNYFVSVTNANNCLNVSQTVPVNVYPIPKPTINVQGGLDICQGDSVILTIKETGTSYRWSNGAKSKSIIIKESETFTGYITNAQGCERETDPISINVRANPKPIISASGPTTFCDGDSIKLKSSIGDSYLWSTGQTTREIFVKTPGSYYVTTFLNNGCSKISLPIEINVLENLKPVITASGSTTICKGDTITLKASPGSLYVWSTGENSQSIKVVNSGTYSVRVYNSDNCSKKSDNVVITVNPRPVALITPSGPTTFCQKDSVTLTATAGASKYVWSNGLETKSIVVKNSGTYWVTVFNAFDCESVSEQIKVTVKDKPIASINVQGPLEFCKGNSVILAASKGKYYEWSTGSKDSTITVVESGSYWVRVFNELGCSDISQFVNVVVRNPTTLVTIPDIEVCVNKGSITLNQEDPKGGKYYGVGIVQNKFNPAVAGVGKHAIVYTYFNEFGCQSNTSFTIEVTPLTELIPGQDTVVCIQSASMFLTNSSLPDGVVFSGNGVNGKKFNPLEAGLGKHIITYTYQNEYSCTSTAKRVITVTPNPSIPTYVGITQGCKDDVLLLSASSSIIGGSSLIYQWYREGEEEPFFIGKDLIYTIRFTERLFVVAKSTSAGSCESDRTEIKITAFNPEGNFTANTTSILQGGPIKFNPSVVGAENYTWDFGDGNKSNLSSPIHYYNSSGTFTVKMTAYSPQGCPVIVTKANYIKVEKDEIKVVPPKSNTEQVLDQKVSKNTSVYPNPLTGNRAKLKIFNNGKTTATSVFEVYAVSGNLIMRKEIAVQPGENVVEVSDFSLLNAQTYYLFVITVNDEKSIFKVLKL